MSNTATASMEIEPASAFFQESAASRRLPDSVAREILQAVLDQGQLTKLEIMEGWGLDEEQYSDFQIHVAESGKPIVRGPRRIGGFVVKQPANRSRDGIGDDSLFNDTTWEASAIDRLLALLTKPQLEELVGSLVQAIRRAREHETGDDRHATKRELAAALMLQHGQDLFSNSEIRKVIARAARTECPKRWCSGKAGAIEFVVKAGFPRELAGIPAPESLPDYELLEGRFKLHELRDFQIEVKTKLTRILDTRGDRAILTLPTGAGKTRVAVEAIRDWLVAQHQISAGTFSKSVLWLAHTEELCEQAVSCFKQVWEDSDDICSLHLVRFWGSYTDDLLTHRETLKQAFGGASVLVSTPQRIVNLIYRQDEESHEVVQSLKDTLALLFVDEAHRAAAPSYQQIFDELANGLVSTVGLTATPFRAVFEPSDEEGTRSLKGVFGKLIEPTESLGASPRKALQERGILAEPRFETIRTEVRMRIPGLFQGVEPSDEECERIDRIMAVRTDRPGRRLAVRNRVLPLARQEGNSILYFGPSVQDAECMAYLLRREGISAAVVSGNTRAATRRQIVSDFRNRKIRVLCNCEVLTTGFDAPVVTHLVMARPTVSQVLYEQMLGRGLRGEAFGGTKICTILDCEDNLGVDRPRLGYEGFRQVWEEEMSDGFRSVPRRQSHRGWWHRLHRRKAR
jgi:superfamily II DNA or RNA helicase